MDKFRFDSIRIRKRRMKKIWFKSGKKKLQGRFDGAFRKHSLSTEIRARKNKGSHRGALCRRKLCPCPKYVEQGNWRFDATGVIEIYIPITGIWEGNDRVTSNILVRPLTYLTLVSYRGKERERVNNVI